MPTKTRINVEVTEADIERAHKNDSYRCVVAQAVARTVPSATNIEVDTQTVRFTVDGERRIYLTPYAVQGYVIAFDAGDPIESFSFQLRDPRRARRRVKTEAGKKAERAANRARRAARVDTPAKVSTEEPNEREAAKAAYAEARKANPGPTYKSEGPHAPPRVFKRKRRSYGQRLLRINAEAVE